MNEYKEIKTKEDLEALMDDMKGFHDGMTKEVHMINRGYVDQDGAMMMGHRFDARLLVQSQWEPCAIELLFIDVLHFEMDDPGEYCDANGWLEHDQSTGKQSVHMAFDKSLSVVARQLFCCIRKEWIGPRSRFGTEVPSPEMVPASRIDDSWRQCSNCANIFQLDQHILYAICPDCGYLTELEIS